VECDWQIWREAKDSESLARCGSYPKAAIPAIIRDTFGQGCPEVPAPRVKVPSRHCYRSWGFLIPSGGGVRPHLKREYKPTLLTRGQKI
jgi:hypothetical protein